MRWRPEGLKNPHIGKQIITEADLQRAQDWEDGADAILDALFEAAKKSPTGTFTIDSRTYMAYSDEVKP